MRNEEGPSGRREARVGRAGSASRGGGSGAPGSRSVTAAGPCRPTSAQERHPEAGVLRLKTTVQDVIGQRSRRGSGEEAGSGECGEAREGGGQACPST